MFHPDFITLQIVFCCLDCTFVLHGMLKGLTLSVFCLCLNHTDHWLWLDRSVVDYTNWEQSAEDEEYNDYNYDCAFISTTTKQWQKQHCLYDRSPFICKTVKGKSSQSHVLHVKCCSKWIFVSNIFIAFNYFKLLQFHSLLSKDNGTLMSAYIPLMLWLWMENFHFLWSWYTSIIVFSFYCLLQTVKPYDVIMVSYPITDLSYQPEWVLQQVVHSVTEPWLHS